MTESEGGIIVGILGQWASGKSAAAKTLIGHLGGESNVVFITDRRLFARQAVKYVLELEDSEIMFSTEEDGTQRLESELATVWLGPGEDLKTVDAQNLSFKVHDDDVLNAWRDRAKVELGPQIRERSADGKPIVIEAAFGPNPEPTGETPVGRTIADLFARLEGSGVELKQVRWIIVEASLERRSERNAKRPDRIPVAFFKEHAAEGGDLDPDHQHRLEGQGVMIQRVPNEHDDIERFRADILAAFEEMFPGVMPARTAAPETIR